MKNFLIALAFLVIVLLLYLGFRYSHQEYGSPSEGHGREVHKDSAPVSPTENKTGLVRSNASFPATAERPVPNATISLRDNPAGPASLEIIRTLSTNDEAAVIAEYQKGIPLTNKAALTWALARVGGDVSARELAGTLSRTYPIPLNLDEELVLRDTVFVMGFIAARSQIAYDFLNQASTADYWKQHRQWHTAAGPDEWENQRYANLTIMALGISGRPGIDSWLLRFRDLPPETIRSNKNAGAIATAAFYYDTATTRGPDTLLRYFHEGQLDAYQAWTATERGRPWYEWFNSIETRH